MAFHGRFSPEDKANKNAANGYAGLNGSSLISAAQLPLASGATRGAVIVGSNLTNTSGTVSLTSSNIDGALGYNLDKRLVHMTDAIILGNNDWSSLLTGGTLPTYDATDRGMSFTAVSQSVTLRVRMPIDPNSKYYLRARVKKVSGDGSLYIGAVSLDGNYSNIATDNQNSYNYFAASNLAIAAGNTTTVEGEIGGYNPVAPTAGVSTAFDPEAKYFDIVIICNYNGTAGPHETVIEQLALWRVPNELRVNGDVIASGNVTAAGVTFADSSAYWLATATNWGLYWNTTDNRLEFRGGGTVRHWFDLDDGLMSAAGYYGSQWTTNSGDGNGFRLWGSDNYKIWMSTGGNATWGGRMSGETTSDYNMYFRMVGGTNRGYVFLTGADTSTDTPVFAINPDGVRAGVAFTAVGLTSSSGLTVSSGTVSLPAASVADGALSANVPLENGNNVFTGTNEFQGLLKIGDGNQDVLEQKSAEIETHTRSTTTTYNADGTINVITELDGATTVKTTTFAYHSDGRVNTVTIVGGGKTVTITYSYDANLYCSGQTRTVV